MLPVAIEPESLKIIETYLENGSSIDETALVLGLTKEQVIYHLNRPESKNFLDSVFMDAGFRNRERFFGLMDTIIDKKLEEMEESGMYSGLDIVELLEKMHKMKIQEMQMQIKLEESKKAAAPAVQTNIQINSDANYSSLIDRLVNREGK